MKDMSPQTKSIYNQYRLEMEEKDKLNKKFKQLTRTFERDIKKAKKVPKKRKRKR